KLGCRAGNGYIPRSAERCDARSHHDGDAGEFLSHTLALPEVAPGPHLYAQHAHCFGGSPRTPDCRSGLAEAREKTITGCVELPAAEPLELATHDRVVPGEQGLPAPTPGVLGDRARVDDVREEHRRENAPLGRRRRHSPQV